MSCFLKSGAKRRCYKALQIPIAQPACTMRRMSGDDIQPEHADPDWFRPPTRRERIIGAALFIAFGLFFILLFIVSRGFWFRWVLLALAIWSVIVGLRHAFGAKSPRTHP